jgi:hypothetical protein
MKPHTPTNDIYYSNDEKEKYRSVHPPSNREEVLLTVVDKLKFFDDKKGTDVDRFTDETIENDNKSPYFMIASPEDCYDRSDNSIHVNPYCSSSSAPMCRNESEENMKVYSYSIDLLPDMPAFLSISHFSIQQGHNWTEIETLINSFCSKHNPGFVWEFKSTEFLWFCSSIHSNCTHYCTFQIRAFLGNCGDVVIDMQNLDGDSSVFGGYYHALKDILLESTSYSTSSSVLESSLETTIKIDSELESVIPVEDMIEKSGSEVLLMHVLDMMRSDYPSMQMEALKIACELSADGNKNLNKNEMLNFLENGCAKEQMIRLGFLNVLLELTCKCYTVANEIAINGFPLIGHRALKIILNLSQKNTCDKLLYDSIHFKQFQTVIGFISNFSIPCYVQSLQLQTICVELSVVLKQ